MGLKQIGRYEIQAVIGRGGMATVYRAYDPRFEREVAIKVLPSALTHADENFRLRFEQEVKTIIALDHGTVVNVFDFGEADNQPYYVMRLMDGGSLADRVRAGLFSVTDAAKILTRLAPALDAAHTQGIVHRDIKPGNILFDQYNDVYLSDFGIAKLIQSAATLTQSNAIIGTPAYMSPEQGRGETNIDGRSDIYALGAVLFEMLSGRVPYEAETPTGQIIKHITDPVPNILEIRDDLPSDCQIVIERAMAKDKSARFDTATEMAQALEKIARGEPIPVEYSTGGNDAAPSSVAHQPLINRKQSLWAGGIIGLISVGFLILWALSHGVLPISEVTPTLRPAYTLTAIQTPTIYSSPRAAVIATASPRPTSTNPVTTNITATPLPFANVNLNVVNLRSGPGIVYPVITTCSRGTEVLILGRNSTGTWLAVQLDETIEGWIIANALDFSGDLQTLVVQEPGPTPTPPFEYSPTATKKRSQPENTPVPRRTTTPTETAPTPYP